MKEKMEDITGRLNEIKSQKDYLGLSQIVAPAMQQATIQTEALRNQRETSSVVGSEVLGRDGKKQEIITQLLKDDQNKNYAYAVIPIVGSGGIGKTTLAQYAFNDEQLERHFDFKAWVCVSDVFDVTRITTTILKAILGGGSHVENITLNEAQMKLKQALTGRKFLIVLDDIWNEKYDAWDKLQEPFKHAAKGSRVIMTTRNEDIARMMINRRVHDDIISLKGLSDDDCWLLFQQHVNDDSDLTEMQDDIIKKCKGLPLAAKALGGLFKKIEDNGQRRKILESNIWSKESGVLPVLRLSYDYLPAELKRMFAYCSLFPKDYQFNEEEIIFLWMAQGFLQHDEDMKNSGHNYFLELKSRSLFEQYPYYKGSFIMHDLIHDLAQWAAGGTFYAKDTKDIAQVDMKRIRHVYLIEDATMQERQLIASQVRTVYVGGFITNLDFIDSLSYIRALSLASMRIEVLPECIGDLKHLRFLSLGFKRLKELPKSIIKLWNLQTLKMFGSINLKEFPYIGSLKELRYLDITSLKLHEMPLGIRKLTNLKSLGEFMLDEGHGFRVRELKNLNNLQGKLTISGLGRVKKVEDAKEAQLHEKCDLDDLYLDWNPCVEEFVDDDIKREVVELLKPPTSIKVCALNGYMGLTLPGWLGDPCFNKMVKIKLEGCAKCERLPPLGQLPCLKTLFISSMDRIKQIGVEFYGCSNPFSVLEYLNFTNMKSWEKWEQIPSDDDNIAFPSLKDLEIIDCSNLESLPSEMHKFTSLQYLKIVKCPKLQCSPEGRFPENRKSIEIEDVKINKGVHDLNLSLSSSSLTKIDISEIQNLKNLSIVDGTNLKNLVIQKCLNLESLVGNFSSLQELLLINCTKLQSIPSLNSLSIGKLELWNLGSSTDAIEQIPGPDLELPLSLHYLTIEGFQNLKTISCSTLPNLTLLFIFNCPKFESFGDTALPPQIDEVYISECEMIKPHLQSDPHNGIIYMDNDLWSLC